MIKWTILVLCVIVQIILNVIWFMSPDGSGYGLGFSSGFLAGMITLAVALALKARNQEKTDSPPVAEQTYVRYQGLDPWINTGYCEQRATEDAPSPGFYVAKDDRPLPPGYSEVSREVLEAMGYWDDRT